MMYLDNYDVAVIGAGHAGVEAAVSAASIETLLLMQRKRLFGKSSLIIHLSINF